VPTTTFSALHDLTICVFTTIKINQNKLCSK
jgi:hypothetical protein